MASPSFPTYVTAADLPRLTGYSAMHLWRLRQAGQFPEGLTWGLFQRRWHINEVRAWSRRHPNRRTRRP